MSDDLKRKRSTEEDDNDHSVKNNIKTERIIVKREKGDMKCEKLMQDVLDSDD